MSRERMVPAITADTRVSADNAMVDRFQVEVGDWRVLGTRAEIAARLSLLSGHEVESALGDSIQLFNEANFQDFRWRHTLVFRGAERGRSQVTLHPLVSGRLVGSMSRAGGSGEDAPMLCTLRLEATLNATRYLQGVEFAPLRRGQRPATNGRVPLAIAQRPDWWADERPLEVCDNVIIGKRRRFHYALSRPIEDSVAEYLSEVIENLTQAMVDRELLPEDPGLNRTNRPSGFRLGDTEVYWEFDHPNPIPFVDVITHFLPRAAHRMRTTALPLSLPTRELSQQSQSATIYLSRKRQVRVYAKTNRRIRFEVGFPDGYISGRSRSARFLSVEALAEEIATLKTEAAETVNQVLENLSQSGGPEHFPATPEQLRNEIARAAGNPFDAATIIETLMRHGRISLQRGDGLRPVIRELATRRPSVLRTLESDRNTYVVTPVFEYARRNLNVL